MVKSKKDSTLKTINVFGEKGKGKSILAVIFAHARGLGREMNTASDDIMGLQQRLIMKREIVRLRMKEDEKRKEHLKNLHKVKRINDEESRK